MTVPESTLALFRAALHEAGLVPDEIIADGQLRRCGTEGKERGQDGAYVLHPDAPVSGWFENHRTGESGTWTEANPHLLPPEDRKAWLERVERDKAVRRAEAQRRHEEAAQGAKSALGSASDCQEHPYLASKGVASCPGLKVDDIGRLLVPVLGEDDRVMSVQRITPNGDKRFFPGGRTRGGYFAIKGDGGPLHVAEGLSTGLSIHAATGGTVLCAFNAGNLGPVAEMVRARCPGREIIIAGDDDHQTEGNPGRTKAEAAARAVGGKVALPRFVDPDGKTDFNDMAQEQGPESVAAALAEAVTVDLAPELPEPDHPAFVDPPLPEDGPLSVTENGEPQLAVGHEGKPEPAPGLSIESARVDRFVDRDPAPYEWTIQDSLLTQSLGVVFATGGTGKGYFNLQLAIAVAAGIPMPCAPWERLTEGCVAGLFAEDQENVVHHRLSAVLAGMVPECELEQARARLKENLFIPPTNGRDMRLIADTNSGLASTGFFAELSSFLKGIDGLSLVLLDPFSRFYAGEENDNNRGTFFCSLMERIIAETGATIIVSHHTNKAGSRGIDNLTPESSRGATALINGARWALGITSLNEQEVKKIGGDASPENRFRYLAGQVCKKNVGPPEDIFYMYRGDGGVLEPFEPTPQTDQKEHDDRSVLDQVVKKVRDLWNSDAPLSKRDFATQYKGEWRDYGRQRLERVITEALAADRLFEVKVKGVTGRPKAVLSPYRQAEDSQ